MTTTWRRTGIDTTSSRPIDFSTTSVWCLVPAGYCLSFSYRDPVFHIVSLSLVFHLSKVHPEPLFNIVFLTFSLSYLPFSVLCRFLFAILFWLSPSRTSRKHCQPITASRSLLEPLCYFILEKSIPVLSVILFFFSVLLYSFLFIFPLCSVRHSLLLYSGKV